MASLRQLTRVTLARTVTTPTIDIPRDISTHEFKGIVTLKEADKKEVIENALDYCVEAGFDDMGADHAIIAYVTSLDLQLSFDNVGITHIHSAGGNHVNPNDKVDTFRRATVQLFDKQRQPMRFQGSDGRIYDRIHIPADRALWPRFCNGYYTRIK
ncbi:hypothetical protein SCP_0502300 [Sparassis crispa]|uniref:Uncharacterized protein n=1 Tax=Sparassis crispa TaxID=139825 RepID=A0A401GLV1_9APHY|nr:hypothetical protein SCP_0502300 [Sparassis crispa]GBE83183.1 hypothetical protein SCP_0502300 [Sparassis crispa]